MAERSNPPASGANPILVTFAVREESQAFKPPAGVRTLVTGMGRDNAEYSFEYALTKITPRLVISSGFAGGLNPSLRNDQIIFQTDDSSPLYEQLRNSGARAVNFFCARRVAITSEEKQKLWRGTGLDAVEMESETIRDICQQRNIPSAIVRVISDSAMEDLPLDFNTLMTPAKKIHYGKLSWALVRSPWKLAELLSFQHRTIEAARALGAFLDKFLRENSL